MENEVPQYDYKDESLYDQNTIQSLQGVRFGQIQSNNLQEQAYATEISTMNGITIRAGTQELHVAMFPVEEDNGEPIQTQFWSASPQTVTHIKQFSGKQFGDDQLITIKDIQTQVPMVKDLEERCIRILSLDGGGVRGVVEVEMLKAIELKTGKRIVDMFDLICGTSTGGIIAVALGLDGPMDAFDHEIQADPQSPTLKLDKLNGLYSLLSQKVFHSNPVVKLLRRVESELFTNDGPERYKTQAMEDLVKQFYGAHNNLYNTYAKPQTQSPKVFAASSTKVNGTYRPYLFRNYHVESPLLDRDYKKPADFLVDAMGTLKGHTAKVWEAVRATSAAPTYFHGLRWRPDGEHPTSEEYLFMDGGIVVNNPTMLAYMEAKALWPKIPIKLIVSLGTGEPPPVHDESQNADSVTLVMDLLHQATSSLMTDWNVRNLVGIENQANANKIEYFRFSPPLTKNYPIDEYHEEVLNDMRNSAKKYMQQPEVVKQLDALCAYLSGEEGWPKKMSHANDEKKAHCLKTPNKTVKQAS